jgi:predicted protein tyrosine phosphatase
MCYFCIMEILILPKANFKNKVVPIVESHPDWCFISILDPDDKVALRENSKNYKTWWFYDLEEDVQNYKAITHDQANEIVDFIEKNIDKKKLFVHCTAGVSRSAAIGEFVYELFGGSYQTFMKKNPNTMPSGRILMYLRAAHKRKNTNNDLIF